MSKKNKEKKGQTVTEETASEVEEIKEEASAEETAEKEAPKAEKIGRAHV